MIRESILLAIKSKTIINPAFVFLKSNLEVKYEDDDWEDLEDLSELKNRINSDDELNKIIHHMSPELIKRLKP